jgi:hypothetical protein
MLLKDIAKALRRPEGSVAHKAGRLGMVKEPKHAWTKTDRQKLTRMYGKVPNAGLAKAIGVTENALERMAHYCGLTTPRPPLFSKREHEFIRVNYTTMKTVDIARRLQRTSGGVEAYARKHGWTGTPEKRRTGYARRGKR